MPEKLWTLHPTNAWMVFKAQKLYESSKQITYKPSPPTKYRPQPQNYLTLHPKTPLDPRYRSVKYNKKQTTKKGTQVSWRSILFDLVCLTLIACFFSLFWLYLTVFMYNDLIWYDIMGNVIWLFFLPLFWERSWKPYVCVEHEPLHDETTPGNSRSRTRRDICLAWRFADLVCSFIFIIDGLYPDRFLGFRFIGFLVLASQAFWTFTFIDFWPPCS